MGMLAGTANSKFIKLDYEMINAALDIEINPEMSPVRIHRAVESRLQQMTKKERGVIPLVIWACLDQLDSTGLGEFHKYNPSTPPAGSENHTGWLNVQVHGSGSISLIPRKVTSQKLIQALRNKSRFKLWERLNKPKFQFGHDRVIITTPVLRDLSSDFVSKVFADF